MDPSEPAPPTLRILPPGNRTQEAGELAARLLLLADDMTFTQKVFAEAFVLSEDIDEALERAFPNIGNASAATRAAAKATMLRSPAVQDYTRAAVGYDALEAGLSFAKHMLQLAEEAADTSNPAYVRVNAGGMICKFLVDTGVAAREGFTADATAGGRGGRTPGPLTEEDELELARILEGDVG